jgi:hypothetical protein
LRSQALLAQPLGAPQVGREHLPGLGHLLGAARIGGVEGAAGRAWGIGVADATAALAAPHRGGRGRQGECDQQGGKQLLHHGVSGGPPDAAGA